MAKRFYDMAAESNVDAQIPVMLTLGRLNLYFLLEYLKDVSNGIYPSSFVSFIRDLSGSVC